MCTYVRVVWSDARRSLPTPLEGPSLLVKMIDARSI